MATVDLGKISFTQQGTYNAGTTYAVKDVVQHTDQNETTSFVKIGSSASGQAPQTNGTVNSSHWAILAKGTSIASANKGTYAGGDTYKKGDIVQYTDSGTLSTYIFINNTPTAGQTPSTSGTINSTYWQFVAKGTASVALSWQSVKTSAFTASAGEGYFVNTTSGAIVVTLPSSPNLGDNLQIVDYAGTFATNSVEIDPGAEKIQGATDHKYLSGNREGASLTFIDSTQGWVATEGINEGTQALAPPPYTVTYLCVAGGGGSGDAETGSKYATGGGGAGGYRAGTFTASPGTTYNVAIGSGGAVVTNGSDSSISGTGITTVTSTGGGRGGPKASTTTGQSGGSGGGGGDNGAGGAGNTPSTSPSQGNNGGGSTSQANTSGGGGGGASAVGATGGASSNGGAGGAGTANSITGSSVSYAGGGGGGSGYSGNAGSSGGSGGAGGGGTGSTGSAGQNGQANTGGGGAGGRGDEGSSPSGSSGGSGVVIFSMPTVSYSATITGAPTVTTSGSNKIVQFNGDGTYTG